MNVRLYSKTCVKRPLSKRQNIGFQDQLSLKEAKSATINIFLNLLFSFQIICKSIIKLRFDNNYVHYS